MAVQRFLKFSKFLPEFGWEPIIITVANGSYPYYDESLLKELAPSLRVYRTKTFEPFELYNLLRGKKGKAMPVVSVGSHQKRSVFQQLSEYVRANFFVPDARVGWVKYALAQAEKILGNEKIDAIITTGPPHSTHLIGLKLKEKYGLKWIADLRDPWTGIFYNNILPRTEATKAKDFKLETSVLKLADLVTVISPGMKKEFEERAGKIEVLFNGYDEDDFAGAIATKAQPDSFVIRYIGNLMASQNAEALWKVIAQLDNAVKLEFIGRVDEAVKASIQLAGIADRVTYIDFVDHKAAVKLMQQADMVLFVIPRVKDGALILTGKLFEYLASKTEILSIGPVNGNAADILATTGRKPMIDFGNSTEMEKQLHEAFSFFTENKGAFKYNSGAEANFSRRNQTGLLAEKLNKLGS